ncbi:hypothetical protein QOT17_014243 [Balamuthia mandrillaris]
MEKRKEKEENIGTVALDSSLELSGVAGWGQEELVSCWADSKQFDIIGVCEHRRMIAPRLEGYRWMGGGAAPGRSGYGRGGAGFFVREGFKGNIRERKEWRTPNSTWVELAGQSCIFIIGIVYLPPGGIVDNFKVTLAVIETVQGIAALDILVAGTPCAWTLSHGASATQPCVGGRGHPVSLYCCHQFKKLDIHGQAYHPSIPMTWHYWLCLCNIYVHDSGVFGCLWAWLHQLWASTGHGCLYHLKEQGNGSHFGYWVAHGLVCTEIHDGHTAVYICMANLMNEDVKLHASLEVYKPDVSTVAFADCSISLGSSSMLQEGTIYLDTRDHPPIYILYQKSGLPFRVIASLLPVYEALCVRLRAEAMKKPCSLEIMLQIVGLGM